MTEAQRRQWLRLLRTEQRRRLGTGQAIDHRQKLIDKLAAMAERLRAVPDWREPTPQEKEASRLFAENGYNIRL